MAPFRIGRLTPARREFVKLVGRELRHERAGFAAGAAVRVQVLEGPVGVRALFDQLRVARGLRDRGRIRNERDTVVGQQLGDLAVRARGREGARGITDARYVTSTVLVVPETNAVDMPMARLPPELYPPLPWASLKPSTTLAGAKANAAMVGLLRVLSLPITPVVSVVSASRVRRGVRIVLSHNTGDDTAAGQTVAGFRESGRHGYPSQRHGPTIDRRGLIRRVTGEE